MEVETPQRSNSLQPIGLSSEKSRWMGASLKGRRRSCSPFEMLFKKNLLKAKQLEDEKQAKLGKDRRYSHFKLTDFRQDLAEDSVLDIASYRKEFTRFDENCDGEIDVGEFGQFLRGIGLIPNNDEVKDIFDQIDTNNDGAIEFGEFINVLDHPMVNLSKEDIRKSIEECVKKLEGPQEGSRVLTVGGLRRMLTGRGKMPMTNAEVDDLVGRVFPGELPLGSVQIEGTAIIEQLMTEDFSRQRIGVDSG